MWAIMVITIRGSKQVWNTHSQATDKNEADRVANGVGGTVVPWDDRLLLLDNGVIGRRLQFL